MSLHKTFGVWCDGAQSIGDRHATGCPTLVAAEPTTKEARSVAKGLGWIRIVGVNRLDSRDLSPQCAGREGVTA